MALSLTSFDSIINDKSPAPYSLKDLQSYLLKTHSSENLSFILLVREYRKIYRDLLHYTDSCGKELSKDGNRKIQELKSKLQSIWSDIINNYILTTAFNEINIPCEVRNILIEEDRKIDSTNFEQVSKLPLPMLLEQPYRLIKDLIRESCLSGFITYQQDSDNGKKDHELQQPHIPSAGDNSDLEIRPFFGHELEPIITSPSVCSSRCHTQSLSTLCSAGTDANSLNHICPFFPSDSEESPDSPLLNSQTTSTSMTSISSLNSSTCLSNKASQKTKHLSLISKDQSSNRPRHRQVQSEPPQLKATFSFNSNTSSETMESSPASSFNVQRFSSLKRLVKNQNSDPHANLGRSKSHGWLRHSSRRRPKETQSVPTLPSIPQSDSVFATEATLSGSHRRSASGISEQSTVVLDSIPKAMKERPHSYYPGSAANPFNQMGDSSSNSSSESNKDHHSWLSRSVSQKLKNRIRGVH